MTLVAAGLGTGRSNPWVSPIAEPRRGTNPQPDRLHRCQWIPLVYRRARAKGSVSALSNTHLGRVTRSKLLLSYVLNREFEYGEQETRKEAKQTRVSDQ
jgi:hypothetical protein